jgi:hypothetical protein
VLETFTVASFTPHLGQPFQLIPDGAATVGLELIEATPLGGESAGDRRAPFSIIFRGPNRPVLPQRIYRLAHTEIGAFELFLVPIGPDGSGMRYEAIFT